MKKLFLLPLLILALSGCKQNQISYGLVKLTKEQSLTVAYGVSAISYLGSTYDYIAFDCSYSNQVMVQVEVQTRRLASEKLVHTYFYGTNLNVVVWGE